MWFWAATAAPGVTNAFDLAVGPPPLVNLSGEGTGVLQSTQTALACLYVRWYLTPNAMKCWPGRAVTTPERKECWRICSVQAIYGGSGVLDLTALPAMLTVFVLLPKTAFQISAKLPVW